jgi:gliding motility-associated-like protein
MKRFLLTISIIITLFSLSRKVEAQTQIVTNGAATAAVNFPAAGCAYNWVNDTPGIGLAASGTGDISSFTAVNTGSSPVIATITATPVSTENAYITSSDNPGTVTVINTQTSTITATITVGSAPNGVSVSPDGSRVYVANTFSNNVSVINTSINAVIATTPVGNFPNAVSVSYDGSQVFVSNINDGTVSVITTASNTVTATISGFNQPFSIAASPTGNFLYVANSALGTVSVVNTATNTIKKTITVGDDPWQIAVSPDGSRVYVTNLTDNTVSVINTSTNSVVSTIAVGLTPEGLTVSPDGSFLYVGCFNAGNVTVINTNTDKVINTINVGSPLGISVTADGKKVYAVNNSANSVSVISTVTNSVIATVPVGPYPNSFGNFIGGETNCNPVTLTITVNPTPTSIPAITNGTATGTISACEGTASASPDIEQFTVSGGSLTGDIIVSAPNNFEVSLSPGTGYGQSVTLVQTGGTVNNTTVYVQSSASALSGNISGNVTLISGVINRKVPVTGTVNASLTVNPVPNQGPFLNGSTTAAINFTGAGNTFNWVNDTPAIGLAASGTGNIAPFTAVNTGATPVIATIIVNPASLGYAYIANSISNDVSVIKTATMSVITTIPVGQGPTGVSVSPDGSRVYIPNQRSNTVSVISTATNKVISTITIAGFGPTNVSVSPDGTRLYVVNLNSNNVAVINTATNALIAAIGVGGYPAGIAVSPDGSRVYVANSSNSISVIDAASNTVKTTIPVGKSPYGIAVSPDGSKVYVALSGANSVIVINTATDQVVSTIPVGANPAGVSVSPNGSRVYVANANDATVSVINTSTDNVVAVIPVGSYPTGISVSPDPNVSEVFVANDNSNSVSVINTAINAVIATITVGSYPVSLGNFVMAGTGCTGPPVKFTITVDPLSLPAVITALGSPAPLTTIYGTASSSTSISISGTNMTAGILVTPPAGFEVSIDNITYSGTVTIGTSATIVPTTVYIRLSSSTRAGNYMGNIILSSTGATNVSVVMPLSLVTPAPLTITADNKSKIFGQVNPAFTVTYSGFVNGDGPAQLTTQPVVTTTAATISPVGQYPITVTGAVSPNYAITPVPGTLTINPAPHTITIPTAFTPNGDGINDTWKIKYLDLYPNCTVEIYNRYGEHVYSSIGYGMPWDGTYKGAALPTSTYYYIINLKNGNEVLSGFVAIIR